MTHSFNKLKQEGNSYFITSKVAFDDSQSMSNEDVKACFDFSFEMSFGRGGEHRDHRSGGSHRRKNGEIFVNTFQGKLAEYLVYRKLTEAGIESSEPDLEAYELGRWDNFDFNVNGKKINIKSTKFYGNLLLLETKDWDENGRYIPNLQKEDSSSYDFFIFVRIKPDIEKLMKFARLLYSNEVSKEELAKKILEERYYCDVPGYIENSDLMEIITSQHVIPRKGLLNGKIPMDAENYYVQAGDMKKLNVLSGTLKMA